MRKSLWAAGAALALVSSAAWATITFDVETGTGFIGKGDIQYTLGWNNKQLQDGAGSLEVSISSSVETTWTCDRDAGDQTQERANTTTIEGLLVLVARERNQITGFYLQGYNGDVEEEHEGPAVGSCPTGWTAIDIVEGEPTGGGLLVNGVPLAEKPL